jgi:uncharacterized protein
MENKIKLVGPVLLAVLVAGGVMAGIWLGKPAEKNQPPPAEAEAVNPKTAQVPLKIGAAVVQAEVRRTAKEQALGLSWRETMGADEAMVFVYERAQAVTFWMKGMQFPLDFIWVRENKVVEITEGVLPPNEHRPEPQVVYPAQQVDMVIEVNAGFVKQEGIKIGDRVDFRD